jgi:serine/threonine protein kinase
MTSCDIPEEPGLRHKVAVAPTAYVPSLKCWAPAETAAAIAHGFRSFEVMTVAFFSPFFEHAYPSVPWRYQVQQVVGAGSSGTVVKALDCVTGRHVAIKRILNVFDCTTNARRVLREIQLLRHLASPNVAAVAAPDGFVGIAQLHTFLVPPCPFMFNDVFVVMEMLDVNLFDAMRCATLTSDHVRVFMFQLLRGVEWMHRCGVLHRDIKPQNIMLKADCTLKLCDLGMARQQYSVTCDCNGDCNGDCNCDCNGDCNGDGGDVGWSDYVSTRWYRSPELCGVFKSGQYTSAVDMWSVGCVFGEMLLGGHPMFPGRDMTHQLVLIYELMGAPSDEELDRIDNRVARNFIRTVSPPASTEGGDQDAPIFDRTFSHVDPAARSLLRGLLAREPKNRLSAAQALRHDYFWNGDADTHAYNCHQAASTIAANIAAGRRSANATMTELRLLIFNELHVHCV